MSLAIKTKTLYPLSLSEAKRHLRVEEDWHEDDDYISNLIKAATQKAEQYIGKDIALTNNVQTIKNFYGTELFIDEGNFVSFTSAVTDASISLTVSEVEIGYNWAEVTFDQSVSSCTLNLNYLTGYQEALCPEVVKQAILVKIGDLYDIDRQSYTIGSIKENKAFEALLDSFRYISF